jgi:molybdopterin converting factor small subunit
MSELTRADLVQTAPGAKVSSPRTAHPAASAPTITVHIPGPLRPCCAGASELAVAATSVGAVLEEFERRHPALHRSICDETGTVRRHINLFVNTDHMRDRNGLDTPLAPGDVVTILPAVSGG